MHAPPFKKSSLLSEPSFAGLLSHAPQGMAAVCCGDDAHLEQAARTEVGPTGRRRLSHMELHLHCSVIGTCLGTAELRKLMSRFIDVRDASDLDVHHEAVRLASHSSEVGRTLNKLLDQRHASTLRVFSRARDEQSLAAAWEDACRQGEIPGAYWALLSHPKTTPELRQRAFGEVHMLSHLVGAANRADIRRLEALERENAELVERLERDQERRLELVGQRKSLEARLASQAMQLERLRAQLGELAPLPPISPKQEDLVALHTQRCQQAEKAAAQARAEAEQLREDLSHARAQLLSQGQELAAADAMLHATASPGASQPSRLSAALRERRILYVGGRPSSTPAIRELVQTNGGLFTYHDGGLETRKGLLAAAIPTSDLVVFPVDCVDHDSVASLKRLCERHGVPFLPLRRASLTSFAASVMNCNRSTVHDARDSTLGCARHA